MDQDNTYSSSRRRALQAIGTIGALSLAGCLGGGDDGGDGGDTDGSDGSDAFRAAWVTDTSVGDLGWSWAHNQGRQAVEDEYDGVETTIQEEVSPSEVKEVMGDLSRQGYDVIFGCAFGYGDAMESLSEEYSGIAYEHATGVTHNENLGIYFGRQYQCRYLVGQAAGLLDDVDTVGYVGAYPLPEVIRGINAFTLGARSVDEDITVKVRWTNTWYDPPKEGEAATSLIDVGADLMVQHQDSPSALKTAANNDIWATGYQAPMGDLAGDNYLTSPIWQWSEFYKPTIESVRDGSWEGDFDWSGLNQGVVDIDEFGPEVPSGVVDEVESIKETIESGELDIWNGTEFEDKEDWWMYAKMESFVDGVDGKIPS